MSLTMRIQRPVVGAPLCGNIPVLMPIHRGPAIRFCASPEQAAVSGQSVQEAADILQRAAADASVPPAEVFQALRSLEKAKLPSEGWAQSLGGTPGGRRWRLIFTSSSKQVKEGMKGGPGGGGKYFPVTAVQRWDGAAGKIENGIFLGHIAALSFSGPYALAGKKLSFDFDTLKLKLGPAKVEIPLKKRILGYKPSPKDPFFLFFFVSEEVVAARGRSGGVAYWARTSPAWELEKGVV